MIISVCGNGYSGSSALTDYLRENALLAVSPYDIEFSFLYDVDGLDDLRYHLVTRPVRFYSSDAAIKRFKHYIKSVNSPNSLMRKLCGDSLDSITDDYLNSIIQLSWNGWWHFDVLNAGMKKKNWNYRFLIRLNKYISKISGKQINVDRKSEMYISIEPKDFDSITRAYVNKLVSFFNPEGLEYVVLDQPYPVGMSNIYQSYFDENLKTINVIRDPRDVFVSAKVVNRTYSSWIPTDDVNNFIEYYKKLYVYKDNGSTIDEITIHFEDLIYNYDITTNLVDNFIGVSCPKNKKFFNPDISINNTQLFKKYTGVSSEIRCIEDKLSDYLYDFDSINAPQCNLSLGNGI